MSSVKQVKFEKSSKSDESGSKVGSADSCNDGDHSNKTKKKEYRKRMKGLLSNVRKQMEFYFGDANINKDRFMKQHVDSSPDGYLPISLFLSFHKIQSLTDSSEIVARALSKSDLLAVSEDKTKVRRTRPVHYMTQEEVDAKTVYVEGLPKHADHDWISNHFSVCGRVAYVSLPRYRQTGDIKGFAFVEFFTPEEATKAVETLNKVPEEVEEEEKVSQSIKTLKNLKYWRNRALKEGIDPDKEVKEEPPAETVEEKSQKKSKKQKKRKRRTSEVTALEGGQAAKKAKTDDAETEAKTQQESSISKAKDSNSNISKENTAAFSEAQVKKTNSHKGGESKVTAEEGGEQKSLKRKCKSESVETNQLSEETAAPIPKVSKPTDEVAANTVSPVVHTVTDTADSTSGRVHRGVDVDPTKEAIKQEEETASKAVKREADTSCKDEDPKKKKQKSKQTTPGKKSADQKESKESVETKKRKRKSVDKGEGVEEKRRRKETTDLRAASEGESDKKKKRKRRKKGKKEPFKLRVMSKKEWTELKREYLGHQRASMASLKQQLKVRQTQISSSAAAETSEPAQAHGQQTGGKEAKGPVIRSAPEFIPDVIVQIKSDVGMYYKQLKEQIEPGINIAYVDVKDNQLSGHVRCKDVDSARRLAAVSIPHCTLTLVQGDAEKAYWDKMVQDRESKLNNTKRRKKRGASKLLDRAQNATMESMQKNHILFDET